MSEISFEEAKNHLLPTLQTVFETASTDEGLLYLDKIRDNDEYVNRYLNEPSINRQLEELLED